MDGIKSLAEIQSNDSNNASKEKGESMKDGNKGSCGGASRTKSKLIMKGKCGRGARRVGYMYLRLSIFSNILVRWKLV